MAMKSRVAESLLTLNSSTCYKASGWTLLETQGFKRSRQDYYVEHERPKQLWVRELRPGARTILRAQWAGGLKGPRAGQVPDGTQAPEQLEQMLRFLRACAIGGGARRLFGGLLGDGGRGAALWRASRPAGSGRVCGGADAPHRCERCGFLARAIRRLFGAQGDHLFPTALGTSDNRALEQALLDWLHQVLGPPVAEDDQVSVDGKWLLSSRGVEIVSASAVREWTLAGPERIAEGGPSTKSRPPQRCSAERPPRSLLVTLGCPVHPD